MSRVSPGLPYRAVSLAMRYTPRSTYLPLAKLADSLIHLDLFISGDGVESMGAEQNRHGDQPIDRPFLVFRLIGVPATRLDEMGQNKREAHLRESTRQVAWHRIATERRLIPPAITSKYAKGMLNRADEE